MGQRDIKTTSCSSIIVGTVKSRHSGGSRNPALSKHLSFYSTILMFVLLIFFVPYDAGGLAMRGPEHAALPLPQEPKVFLLDVKSLSAVKEEIRSGSQRFALPLKGLIKDAEKALLQSPFSVVGKKAVPPSGDRHDYLSQAPYWWPNSKTADGLPYVRRDGERNPATEKITDHKNMNDTIANIRTLSLACYFTGDERYAVRASFLLRKWFLDEDTRMNPSLNYGQFVPGSRAGRPAGIIETRNLPEIIDAVGLMGTVKDLAISERKGLESWFTRYLDWLLNSELGKKERGAKNNHGTWYDAQVVPIAFFLGRHDLASQVLRDALKKRLAAQIEPDGRQPLELARTNAWSYSLFNLGAFFRLAACGEHLGLNIWDYRTADGRGIRTALDWLIPFASGKMKWPYGQINGLKKGAAFPLLRQAAVKYQSRVYRQLAEDVAPLHSKNDRLNLLFPQIQAAAENLRPTRGR